MVTLDVTLNENNKICKLRIWLKHLDHKTYYYI